MTYTQAVLIKLFLIHPSVKTRDHNDFAEKVDEYLNEVLPASGEENARTTFKGCYEQLKQTKKYIADFDVLYNDIINYLF